jgi:ketosteroid isomerase-like protein
MSKPPQLLLAEFLSAFSHFDLDAMLACFAPEATAFFPVEHQRTRLEGKDAISAAFSAAVNRVRSRGASSLSLAAENLIVQQYGDTAVATFHLRSDHLSRRTVVMRRDTEGWRIVHLHASNAPLAE